MEIIYKGRKILLDAEDFQVFSQYNWSIHKNGYLYRKVEMAKVEGKRTRRMIYFHRLIVPVSDSTQFVDHLNGDKLDNRKQNLRICTSQQNTQNRGIPKVKGKSSIYKGVHKFRNKWKASIGFNNKVLHLGYFVNEKDAAKAYNKAAKKLHGQFAVINEGVDG